MSLSPKTSPLAAIHKKVCSQLDDNIKIIMASPADEEMHMSDASKELTLRVAGQLILSHWGLWLVKDGLS